MYNRHTLVFEFDPEKEAQNIEKHGIDFKTAEGVFFDDDAIITPDSRHSVHEPRWFSVGKVGDGRIITVWFTRREEKVRIIGAAELRKWRKEYEKRKATGSQQVEMD